jgi:hypothetical protein
MTAAQNLAMAWAARATRARETLLYVRTGWTLFKPEYIQDLIDEANEATAQATFWAGQTGGPR